MRIAVFLSRFKRLGRIPIRRTKEANDAILVGFGPLHSAIASSERRVVRGPIAPMVSETTTIAAAMSAKTPPTPKRRRKKAMTKALSTVESRLQE